MSCCGCPQSAVGLPTQLHPSYLPYFLKCRELCMGRICFAVCFLLAKVYMALASRCQVVLLSLLCPWLEGDVCCSWMVAGEQPCFVLGKESLKMAEEASRNTFIVSSYHCCCHCCSRCSKSCRQTRNSFLGGGEERTSKEYKDFQRK